MKKVRNKDDPINIVEKKKHPVRPFKELEIFLRLRPKTLKIDEKQTKNKVTRRKSIN